MRRTMPASYPYGTPAVIPAGDSAAAQLGFLLDLALDRAKQTINNQVGKPTVKPTLRWVFQCFMSIHLLTVNGVRQITNLTQERLWILQFFGAPCRKYYLLS